MQSTLQFDVNGDRLWAALRRSWIEHNLSELLALFKPLMGRTRFAQRICAVDHRFELAAEDVLKHLVKVPHRSHIGTQERKLPAEKNSNIELCFWSGGGATGNQRPAWTQRTHALVEGRCTNVLEDN